MIHKLEEVKNSLDASTIEAIESEIQSIIRDIKGRNKLKNIADRTEGGWSTVEEYETCDYAEDSDDNKKIRQTNARALQKKRRLQPRRPAMVLPSNIDRPHLFRTGPQDHLTYVSDVGSFPKMLSGTNHQQSTPGISSPLFQYPQSIGWGSAALPTMQTGSARKAGN